MSPASFCTLSSAEAEYCLQLLMPSLSALSPDMHQPGAAAWQHSQYENSVLSTATCLSLEVLTVMLLLQDPHWKDHHAGGGVL